MNIKRKFASNLLFLRENAGLTQSDTARRIGISYSRYQHWERGEVLPQKPELLIALADLFGVKVDDLLRRQMVSEAA